MRGKRHSANMDGLARESAAHKSHDREDKEMGFKNAQEDIAEREGISMDRAGAILASSSRHASAPAKGANPNLKKVKK